MSGDKIDIVVYSESFSFVSMLRRNLVDSPVINLVESLSSFGEMQRSRFINGKSIFILHTLGVLSGTLDNIVKNLEFNGMSFVVVCEDANGGFEMMKKGALSIVVRKNDDSELAERLFMNSFVLKVKDAFNIKKIMNKREVKKEVHILSDKVIVIGASTGGTEAIVEILKQFPAEMPPILIVQHMPAVFTRMYADRLNDVCELTVWEAKDGDKIQQGVVLIAPGDYQMKVVKGIDGFYVECFKGAKVNGLAPSVDVLFDSVADVIGRKAIGVILTGMGEDGARGMLKMHDRGAYNIGQDEKSCVVYGMPKAAYEMGAVDEQASLNDIARRILSKI